MVSCALSPRKHCIELFDGLPPSVVRTTFRLLLSNFELTIQSGWSRGYLNSTARLNGRHTFSQLRFRHCGRWIWLEQQRILLFNWIPFCRMDDDRLRRYGSPQRRATQRCHQRTCCHF